MPATVTRLYDEASLEEQVRAVARQAGLAFRVLRDARVLSPVSQLRFLARVGDGDIAELAHPGPWSASLEPRVRLFPHGDPAAPFAGAFAADRALQALAILSSPYLAAVAAAGRDLDLSHPPAAARTRVRRLVVTDGQAAAPLPPHDAGARAVLLSHGELLAWSDVGVLDLAEWLTALEETARLVVEAAAYRAALP